MMLLLAQSAATAATPAQIAAGEKVFSSTCAVGYCHGAGGAGNRGPRLRGRTFAAGYVERTVRQGIPNSAMPSFEDKLNAADLAAVVAYVTSIAAPGGPAAAAPAGGSAGGPPPPSNAGSAAVPPPEAATGLDLFFDATRGTRCGTCHQASGRGLKVGPDVASATRRDPGGLAAAMNSSRASLVRRVVLRSGESFPAVVAAEDQQTVRVFDLSAIPPSQRTLMRTGIASLEMDPGWSHRQAISNYSDAELADIARYLLWLGQR
jgi:mono/diheme cytochrome c family protein